MVTLVVGLVCEGVDGVVVVVVVVAGVTATEVG